MPLCCFCQTEIPRALSYIKNTPFTLLHTLHFATVTRSGPEPGLTGFESVETVRFGAGSGMVRLIFVQQGGGTEKIGQIMPIGGRSSLVSLKSADSAQFREF